MESMRSGVAEPGSSPLPLGKVSTSSRPGRSLRRARVVITGSHPEYWSEQMLDAWGTYLRQGGRLVYLGGNGLPGSRRWIPRRSTRSRFAAEPGPRRGRLHPASTITAPRASWAACGASADGPLKSWSVRVSPHSLVADSKQAGSVNPRVRADMVYFETPNDGAVFSVGSINWLGSLSHNDYDNNAARMC